MNLSNNFTLEEFTRSAMAEKLHIDNSLPEHLLDSAFEQAKFMEGIRSALSNKAGKDIPIHTSSCYRCGELNAAVGSKPNGDHPLMCATDFEAPDFGTPYQVAKFFAPMVNELGIGQLIYEGSSSGARWVHVSRRPTQKIVNRVITISPAGTELGIQEVK
jgi:zinc D-Ala-D-Ala carboxypeptidase